jgi:UDP-N-acetylmuramate dehydrogenase
VSSGERLAWLDSLSGIKRDEPLAPHTTYHIGGLAERYLEAGRRGLIGEVTAGCSRHDIPLFAIGNGSNVLVSDTGIEGLVLRITESNIIIDGDSIVAAAGARMVKVAQAAEHAGLTGMEWALGIPGTVGGSIYNNAGCFGGDIDTTVSRVGGFSADGSEQRWTHGVCAFRYRGSAFRDGALAGAVVSHAVFRLSPSGRAGIRLRMEEVQEARKETQPVTGRSTGSVFKNPPGDFAARLIDEAGMKGTRVGGAMVSLEHANFIVNAEHAAASDVAQLVRRVRETVRSKFDVELELEMEPVGLWSEGDL